MNNTKFISVFRPADALQAGLIRGALENLKPSKPSGSSKK
jgi:hypothetical protein